MIPKCTSWRGHKFEGRYSFGEPTLDRFKRVQGVGHLEDLIEASKAKTYERDICTRCGHVIEKAKP